jgi:glutathione reductase (NADPH)
MARAADHGIRFDGHGPRLEWRKLMDRKRAFVESVPRELEESLRKEGTTLVRGHAKFVGARAVEVDATRYEARKVIVATGSRPRAIDVPGGAHAITSDDVLELYDRPASVVFLGAGVIGLEFAHVFARAGCRVTILEIADRPLGPFDADAVAQLVAATRAAGIELATSAKIASVEKKDAGFVVNYEHGGQEHSLATSYVVNGAGRVAAVEDLGLDAAGIEHEGARVKVDRFLRSASNHDVSFAGDAQAGKPQLSPVATYDGRLAGDNAVAALAASANGGESQLTAPDYRAVPSCVFAIPTLASVGLTEEAARKAGIELDVRAVDMHGWKSARTHAERHAWAKVLIDAKTRAIVGAHLFGHGADETIHAFAFAMKHGVTADELATTVYAYPTFHSDIKYLLG